MFRSATAQQRIGRIAWASAWLGLVAGQFHAMARHNTADGKHDLDNPLARAWSDPARELFGPLLNWSDPETVYYTWGKIWLPVFAAFTLCAFVAYRRRQPVGFERWVWRASLVGYVGGTIGVANDFWLLWSPTAQGTSAALDVSFVIFIPFMLLMMIGSTVLGITLLVKGFRPRTAAVLLALALPLFVAIVQVTSQGSAFLPVAYAFGILGRRIAHEPAVTSAVKEAQLI
ncbi:MAG: hypothetical protein LBV34_09920 [Nocardiopsaceae bacterium]|jgi:hypothetical protein|nr:hypothetical protein [Nocardiopsaceae bacterium]